MFDLLIKCQTKFSIKQSSKTFSSDLDSFLGLFSSTIFFIFLLKEAFVFDVENFYLKVHSFQLIKRI